jgi:predicted dehydrogenase
VMKSPAFGRRPLIHASAIAVGALATTALSYRRVLGANDRIRLGIIGTGSRAQSIMKRLKDLPGNEMVAVCDVYQPRIKEALAITGTTARTHVEYREILADKTIDAVVIGSPQHWHKQMTLDALSAGKDIFVEKCVSHSIDEGVAMVKAVEAAPDRVVQTGTQQRSGPHWIQGAEIVKSGKLGEINFINAYWFQNVAGRKYPEWEPDKIDWKRFVGPAKAVPPSWDHYYKWRWFWNFGGGPICELLTHWIDVVHWYMGDSAPRKVLARGSRHLSKYDVPDTSTTVLEYPKFTVTFTNYMGSKVSDGGIEFRGSKGTLKVDRAHLAVYPDGAPNVPGTLTPAPEILVKSQKEGTINHAENFLASLRSSQTPSAPMRVAHEAARASHLANLSLRWGTEVQWDDSRGKPRRA